MSKLTDNIKQHYAFYRQRKENWRKMLRESVNREFRWADELKQYGVERQPSLATMMGPVMCDHFVPEPPIAEDTMTWLADKLTESYTFYVPQWSEFRYIIPPGFGVVPGLYQTEQGTMACQVDDRDALWKEVKEFLEFYPHAAIQKVWAWSLPTTSYDDRIGPVVSDQEMPERIKVSIAGVVWEKDWAAEGCDKPRCKEQAA